MGASTGLNVSAAVQVARKLGPGHTVVTCLCDTGQVGDQMNGLACALCLSSAGTSFSFALAWKTSSDIVFTFSAILRKAVQPRSFEGKGCVLRCSQTEQLL